MYNFVEILTTLSPSLEVLNQTVSLNLVNVVTMARALQSLMFNESEIVTGDDDIIIEIVPASLVGSVIMIVVIISIIGFFFCYRYKRYDNNSVTKSIMSFYRKKPPHNDTVENVYTPVFSESTMIPNLLYDKYSPSVSYMLL